MSLPLFNKFFNISSSGSGSPTITPANNELPSGNGNETIDLVDDLDFKKFESDEIDLELKESKNKSEIKGDDEDDDKKEDDPDAELQELEDELKEPTDEELELTVPSTRRQILKDYPDIFKKHPSLEKSFYRDQKFTEVFEHPKEAIEAKELLDTYSKFEDDVTNGDLTTIINSVKETNPESFNKIVDDFLPMLEKTDRNAWLTVMSNVTKQVLAHAFTAGRKSNDEELQEASRIVHKFLLGTEEYEPPVKLSSNSKKDEKSDKEIELERREKEFNDRTFSTAKSDVEGSVDRIVKATITKHIDPRESMSDYVRRNAVRDAYETFQNQLKNDNSFNKLIERFWDSARKSNYNRQSLDRITDVYKNKAGSLLGAIIKKTRNDALKSGNGTRSSSKKDDDDTSENEDRPRRVVARPRNDGPSNDDDRGKRVIPKGMTTAEWLALKD